VAPFVVFGDVTLRDLACRRPTHTDTFLQIQGVGRHKCQEYGPRFLPFIESVCDQLQLTRDVGFSSESPE
jgi:ATP-dependent DNA helicase RecQ